MRLPRIITQVEEVPATAHRPPSRRYHVPSREALIERWLTRGFPPTLCSYMVYRTQEGVPIAQLSGADTLEQALLLLGWKPQRPARTPRKAVAVGTRWWPQARPPRVRKPRPSSPETREAERQRRQQRREEQKAERAARVEVLMQENDEMLLAHPGVRPLQRREAVWYENQRHRRTPPMSAYALTLTMRRLENEATRREAREQQALARMREEEEREQKRAARRRAQAAEPAAASGPSGSLPSGPPPDPVPGSESLGAAPAPPAHSSEEPPWPLTRILGARPPWGSPPPRVSRLTGPFAPTAEERLTGRTVPRRRW